MVFGAQIYEIWKTSFNVETYMSFMHSELVVFFLPRLPLSISSSVAAARHVSTSWNWTDWKLQNQIWASHKNTLAEGSFFSLFHLIPIPLICFHSVTEVIWASHKNSVANGSFFPLSHLIPIPLICLHSVTKVIWASHKNSVVDGSFFSLSLIWYPFISSFFTLSPRWCREPCTI